MELTAAGRRLLPQAGRVLDAVDEIPGTLARSAPGRVKSLRIGTIDGMGARLDSLLDRLLGAEPDLQVTLESRPLAEHLRQVRLGKLDAVFVRGITAVEGLRVTPLWDDPMVVILPAGHPLAAAAEIDLARLADLPLRLVPREQNPPFVDLIIAGCRSAGFEPVFGPAFTTLQDTVAQIGIGPLSWTILAANQQIPPVGHRACALRVRDPVTVTTALVTGPVLTHLVELFMDCCREAAEAGTAEPPRGDTHPADSLDKPTQVRPEAP